jgi:hypothetical protein
MSRRIVTTEFQAAGGGQPLDSYFDKIVKYIPADVVGAWLAASGLIMSSAEGTQLKVLLWIAFAVGVPLAAAWTLKQTSQPGMGPAITQAAIATASFAIWIFAVGGPFATLSWYDSLYGALVLIAYTLVIGLVTPRE